MADRFCICGNPIPMLLKAGKYSEFYSCSDWTCKHTQQPGSPQPPVGSVSSEFKSPSPTAGQILDSKKAGYEQRKAWHEKRGIPFPETPQHQAMHLASK